MEKDFFTACYASERKSAPEIYFVTNHISLTVRFTKTHMHAQLLFIANYHVLLKLLTHVHG